MRYSEQLASAASIALSTFHLHNGEILHKDGSQASPLKPGPLDNRTRYRDSVLIPKAQCIAPDGRIITKVKIPYISLAALLHYGTLSDFVWKSLEPVSDYRYWDAVHFTESSQARPLLGTPKNSYKDFLPTKSEILNSFSYLDPATGRAYIKTQCVAQKGADGQPRATVVFEDDRYELQSYDFYVHNLLWFAAYGFNHWPTSKITIGDKGTLICIPPDFFTGPHPDNNIFPEES